MCVPSQQSLREVRDDLGGALLAAAAACEREGEEERANEAEAYGRWGLGRGRSAMVQLSAGHLGRSRPSRPVGVRACV